MNKGPDMGWGAWAGAGALLLGLWAVLWVGSLL